MEDFNKRLTDLKTSVINEIKDILPAGRPQGISGRDSAGAANQV